MAIAWYWLTPVALAFSLTALLMAISRPPVVSTSLDEVVPYFLYDAYTMTFSDCNLVLDVIIVKQNDTVFFSWEDSSQSSCCEPTTIDFQLSVDIPFMDSNWHPLSDNGVTKYSYSSGNGETEFPAIVYVYVDEESGYLHLRWISEASNVKILADQLQYTSQG